MNVASFGSMEIDEWEAYETGVALQRCTNATILNYRRAGQTVEECVDELSWVSEYTFVASNYVACCALLVTLLLSSWLYIALSLPDAQKNRPDEVQAVVARFSGEFLALNVFFLLSMVASGAGLNQLVQLKIRFWSLVVFLNFVGGTVLLTIIALSVWLVWEVHVARGLIRQIRKDKATDAHGHETHAQFRKSRVLETRSALTSKQLVVKDATGRPTDLQNRSEPNELEKKDLSA